MSDFQQPHDIDEGVAGARTIGRVLREAREARGETLADVAHALKLAPRQVEAMEAERFDLLPGAAFIKGFLRNYARYLGVDAEGMINALRGDSPTHSVNLTPITNVNATMPVNGSEHGLMKPVAVVVFGMVLALAAGWYFDWFRVVDVEPVAVLTDDAAEEATHLRPPTPEIAPSPEPLPPPAPAPEAAPAPQATPSTIPGLIEVPEAPLGTEPLGAGPEGEPVASETPAESAVVPGEGRLVFRLTGDSWIQVRDADGAALYTGTGAAGTTRTVQGRAPFSVVVGNAGMVELEHNGQSIDLAPHTRSGGVARMTIE